MNKLLRLSVPALFTVLAGALVLGSLVPFASAIASSTAGPLMATVGANYATSGGTVEWKNTGDIASSGDADSDLDTNEISHYLKASGFGFSIPAGATVNGVQVDIRKNKQSSGSSDMRDYAIRLVTNASGAAATSSDNKADTSTSWGTALATTTYGGSSDTWGNTWTSVQINDSSFGVLIAAKNIGADKKKAQVDAVSVTVTYVTAANQTITASAGANGTITPSGSVSVAYGGNQSFTITPNANYHVADVLVDSGSVGAVTSYDFTGVTTAHSIVASFAIDTHTLTYTAGAHGSLTGDASQTVDHGSDGTAVTAVPDTGFAFVDWSDASTANPRTDTNVTTNHSVTANFADSEAPVITLVGSPTVNLLVGDPAYVDEGATASDNLDGNVTGSIVTTVTPSAVSTAATGVFTIHYNVSDAAGNAATEVTRTVNVTDTPIVTHTITVSTGSNGAISPTGPSVTVNDGNNQSFTITPNANYHVADVLVDSGSVGAVTSYDFTGVTADHTISASFAIDTHTLTYTAGANGSITGTSPQTVDYGTDGTAVTAVANSGYHFVDWDDTSTANPRTDTNVTTDHTFTANFAADPVVTHTLAYTAGANGSITGTSPQTVNDGEDGSAVTAVPDSGYHFVDWSDASTANPRTDTGVTGDVTVTANFEAGTPAVTHTLTYTAGANGSIGGIATQTVDDGATGSAVSATGDTGYTFLNWSDGSIMNPRIDSNVTSDLSVSANFSKLGTGGGGRSFTGAAGAAQAPGQVLGASTSTAPVGQVLGETTFVFTKNLWYRMPRNTDVSELQKFLVGKGYSIPNGITTWFGTETLAAVKAFQKDNGVNPTGFVGPLTLELLNKAN